MSASHWNELLSSYLEGFKRTSYKGPRGQSLALDPTAELEQAEAVGLIWPRALPGPLQGPVPVRSHLLPSSPDHSSFLSSPICQEHQPMGTNRRKGIHAWLRQHLMPGEAGSGQGL